MSFLLMLLLTIMASRCDGEETPAMKLILTDKALRYGTQIAADVLCEKIQAVDIPEQQGSVSLGVFGDAHYTLDWMSVVQCRLPEPSVQFDEENAGLKMAVDDLGVTVSGHWWAHYGFIHDDGTFTVSLSDVYASTGVALGSDSEGRPTVDATFCYGGVGDLNVDLEGGGSWLYELFLSEDTIRSQIEARICPGFGQAVQDVQRRLAAMSLSLPVNPDMDIEVPLTSAPEVHSTRLGLDWKGEFYHARNHTEPPFHAEPFTLSPQSDYMVQFGFSEFAVNSASYVYSSSMRAQIDDSMIPKSSPVRLNTTSFGMFVPQLPQMFPNMLMELEVDAAEVPMFRFVSDAVELDVSAVVKAYAVCPNNKTLVPLFKLGVDADVGLKVFFSSQGKAKGSAAMSNFTMTLLSSEVGDFQIAGLQAVVKMALKMLVLPKVNARLSQGVDIPSFHDVQLVNPVLLVKEGFVVIASDVTI